MREDRIQAEAVVNLFHLVGQWPDRPIRTCWKTEWAFRTRRWFICGRQGNQQESCIHNAIIVPTIVFVIVCNTSYDGTQ